jgi:hypothetical protein
MMGGIQPSEADRLTMWQYTAMRTLWNRRHKSGTDEESDDRVEAPDAEFVRQRQAELLLLGIAGSA